MFGAAGCKSIQFVCTQSPIFVGFAVDAIRGQFVTLTAQMMTKANALINIYWTLRFRSHQQSVVTSLQCAAWFFFWLILLITVLHANLKSYSAFLNHVAVMRQPFINVLTLDSWYCMFCSVSCQVTSNLNLHYSQSPKTKCSKREIFCWQGT